MTRAQRGQFCQLFRQAPSFCLKLVVLVSHSSSPCRELIQYSIMRVSSTKALGVRLLSTAQQQMHKGRA